MSTIGVLSDHTATEIPPSHRDLVDCPAVAALTTVGADGYPHTSVERDVVERWQPYVGDGGTVAGEQPIVIAIGWK